MARSAWTAAGYRQLEPSETRPLIWKSSSACATHQGTLTLPLVVGMPCSEARRLLAAAAMAMATTAAS